MYSNPNLHIQALQLMLMCLVPPAIYATSKNRALSGVAVYGVAVWFLIFKGAEYFGSGRLPMDISAVCYFLYMIAAILPVRPFKLAVAQLSALCGLVYGIAIFFAPQIFRTQDPKDLTLFLAIVNHALLFFGGMSVIVRFPLKISDVIWTVVLLAAIITYIEICVMQGVAEGNAVFSKIVDGSIIMFAVPGSTMHWWYYVLYYPIVFTLLGLWIALTYVLNRRVVRPKKKVGIFAY